MTSPNAGPGRSPSDLVRANWRTSSRSQTSNCVEVAPLAGEVAMRDSKDRRGPVLRFAGTRWREFVDGAKDGEFDRS